VPDGSAVIQGSYAGVTSLAAQAAGARVARPAVSDGVTGSGGIMAKRESGKP